MSLSKSSLSDPDALLMVAFQRGDPAAFEKLMIRYFPRLLNFIYQFTKDRELAEDLTQEVFIKVYHHARKYSPKAKFKTWLYTVARNVSLNEMRKYKQKVVSLDEPSETGEGCLWRQVEDSSIEKPDERLRHREIAMAVQEAIDRLPENQRTAVLLRKYEQFSYEEIAQTMKISTKAVKSLLSRARENLKIRLKNL